MRFSDVVKTQAPDLVVSKRHEAWLEHNSNPVYSDRALDFAATQLHQMPRKRKGTISASSLGSCVRKQQFEYLGMPQLPMDTKGAMKVQNGTFMHLRWQMEGLTEGWLDEAEVPVNVGHGLAGTMDGVLYNNAVLELKSINAHGFAGLVTFGPPKEHLVQMSAYLICSNRNKGVFIYENKDTQEYTEIVYERSELPVVDVLSLSRSVQTMIADQELEEPLNDCIDKKGWRYGSCPYRDRCLSIKKWGEVA